MGTPRLKGTPALAVYFKLRPGQINTRVIHRRRVELDCDAHMKNARPSEASRSPPQHVHPTTPKHPKHPKNYITNHDFRHSDRAKALSLFDCPVFDRQELKQSDEHTQEKELHCQASDTSLGIKFARKILEVADQIVDRATYAIMGGAQVEVSE